MRNDPEALARMMNDDDGFSGGRRDGPRAAQEIECVVSVKAALDIESQMQVQERHGRHRPQVRAFFFEG